MKKKTLWMIAAILSICGTATSCKDTVKSSAIEVNEDSTKVISFEEQVQVAIDRYLVDSIGSKYSEGDVCIPVTSIVNTKGSDGSDTLRVWGDFWVYNYRLEGDTLMTVSGGNHPGLIFLSHGPEGYQVVDFDAVEDGSKNLPSARRIFAEYYDAYHKMVSDQSFQKDLRLRVTSDYVKSHGLKAKMLKDYGWDPIELKN